MNEDNLKGGRRSKRLSISIPVVISGVDADGNNFSESVRTVVVNNHGGKIATTHHVALGTEVSILNPALGAMAKASVVWLGEKSGAGDLHQVGLQLLEPQNVWGVAFPPDDWGGDIRD
jgi:hypothetical protein